MGETAEGRNGSGVARLDGSESGEDAAESCDGDGDTVRVVGFGLFCGSLDVYQRKRSDLGDDEEQEGDEMGFDSRLASVGVPVVGLGDFGGLSFELDDVRGGGVGR